MIRQTLDLQKVRLPRGLTVDEVQKHVIAPVHVQNIEIEEVNVRRETFRRRSVPKVVFKVKPRVDVTKFGDAMHEALKDDTAGYILTVRKDGAAIYHRQWRWSRGPLDGNDTWNGDTRMHVASVSKLLTAIGMVQTLDAANLSYDTKIAGYLPAYWKTGPKIDRITFRHLLTHTSGFSTGESSSDYEFMKGKVAQGVSGVGGYDYENMNFGLCRILIPIVRGEMDRNLTIPIYQDQLWDTTTLTLFREYMQAKVFGPSGVNAVSFQPLPGFKNALAYRFPEAGRGWNSGDLKTVAGGAGFRLSITELLDVMSALRRGKLMSSSKAQNLLDSQFGIDQVIDTPAGKLYNKNGGWKQNGYREQCVAYFWPDGMEVAVFVNSEIGRDKLSLRGLVRESFEESLIG